MRFYVGRTEVRISYAMLPFFFWCIAIGEVKMLLLGTVSLAVHECAHMIAARNLGYESTRLGIYPIGAVLQFRMDTVDPRTEWIVAAAGPLGSAALASFLYLIRTMLPAESEAVRLFQTANLSVAALNVIPAFPLDGGRILKSLLCALFNERTAKRIILLLTMLFAAMFIVIGSLLLTRGILPAWTFLAISMFLLPSALREWKTPDPGIIGEVLNRTRAIRKGERKRAVFVVLSSDATIGDAISSISGTHMTFLRILDGNELYELSENELLREAGRFGYGEPLKRLISSLTVQKSCVIIH